MVLVNTAHSRTSCKNLVRYLHVEKKISVSFNYVGLVIEALSINKPKLNRS
uniref:Uncharacterized protein n=1 Tax=Rhizophora mucronata TaxID=61149 RepID=A0A2P2L1W8_RHIMU